MRPEFTEREPTTLSVSRGDGATSFELLHRDAAGSVVLGSYDMEIIDEFLLLALPEKKLWCLVEADYCDTQYTKDKDKDTVRVPDVPPALHSVNVWREGVSLGLPGCCDRYTADQNMYSSTEPC